jgi:hypothetical protein
LTTRFEDACLEFFQKVSFTSTKWFNIKNLLATILEAEWDTTLPLDVREDGRTPRKQLVKLRRLQLLNATNKYLEPIPEDDANPKLKWSTSKWRVQEEFLERVTANADPGSHGKKLNTIYQEIANRG